MQEATFMILTALAEQSQHGYGILTDVQQISGGRVQLRPGYFVHSARPPPRGRADRGGSRRGRRRAASSLLPAHAEGHQRLGAEAARLQAHTTAALTRLNLAGGGMAS